MFEHYTDINHDSGVDCYYIGNDFIEVVFKTTPQYVYGYTRQTVGPTLLNEMKRCALRGNGLNSLISTYCRNPRTFYKKIR